MSVGVGGFLKKFPGRVGACVDGTCVGCNDGTCVTFTGFTSWVVAFFFLAVFCSRPGIGGFGGSFTGSGAWVVPCPQIHVVAYGSTSESQFSPPASLLAALSLLSLLP